MITMVSFINLIIITNFMQSVACDDTDAENFSSQMKYYVDEILAYERIQKHFDNSIGSTTNLDGKKLVNDLRDQLGEMFQNVKAALNNLKEEAERSLLNFSEKSKLKNCCDVDPNVYDPRFKHKVNFSEACITFPSKSLDTNIRAPQSVVNQMIKNAENFPNLHRQYFGMEEGSWTLYPAQKVKCYGYDSRYRPWYVEAVSPIPKDLVIVLDSSNSMMDTKSSLIGYTYLQIAQEAVVTVLETLSPDDRVGIVKFARTVAKPHRCANTNGCYASRLAMKTKLNTDCLAHFIQDDSSMVTDGTNYTLALEEAFKYFLEEKRESLQSRNQVILFVSDGQVDNQDNEDHSKIMKTIANNNHKLNNTVTILTFGVGFYISSTGSELLKSMASQTATMPSYGTVRKGEYVQIKDAEKLRSKLARYYDLFARPSEDTKTIVSAPYFDIFYSGAMITVSVPFFNEKKLAGVVGIDMLVEEVFKNITYFFNEKNSYAFVIDGKGRALAHPLLPIPSSTKSVVLVSILSLERAYDSDEIVKLMMNDEKGTKTSVTRISYPAGNVYISGIDALQVSFEYFYGPVLDTKMSICVVMAPENKISVKMKDSLVESFIYSRFDLEPTSLKMCDYYNIPAITERSTVIFDPRAFTDEISYKQRNTTKEDIRKWKLYFTGKDVTLSNPFKSEVRRTVKLTEIVDSIWTNNTQNETNKFMWRYLAVVDGVMRAHPGTTVMQDYYFTKRPWFIQALNNPERMIFVAPFTDAWSRKQIITLTKGIYQGKHNREHNKNNPVIAVLGGDFSILDFHNMVLENFSICKEEKYSCFVVETSGLILSNDDVLKNVSCGSTNYDFENLHIIERYPAISQALIKANLLKQKSCVNIERIRTQRFWRIRITGERTFDYFSIIEIPKTNLVLIAEDKTYNTKYKKCWCDKSEISSRCRSSNTSACECPCYGDVNFDFCSNALPQNNDIGPICTPQPEDNSPLELKKNTSNLLKCYDLKCSAIRDESLCLTVTGCNWCQNNVVNNSKSKAFCTRYACSTLCPAVTKLEHIGSSKSLIMITVIFVSFTILLVFGAIISIKCFSFKDQGDGSSIWSNSYAGGETNPAFNGDEFRMSSLYRSWRDSIADRDNGNHIYAVPRYPTPTSSSNYEVMHPFRPRELNSASDSLPRPPQELPQHTSFRTLNREPSMNNSDASSLSEYPESVPSVFYINTSPSWRHGGRPFPKEPDEATDVASSINAQPYRPQNRNFRGEPFRIHAYLASNMNESQSSPQNWSGTSPPISSNSYGHLSGRVRSPPPPYDHHLRPY